MGASSPLPRFPGGAGLDADGVKGLFRLLLAIWTIGFLVISCVPLLTGNALAGGVGFLARAVLFVPWLVGVLILSTIVWLTNPSRTV